MVTSYFLRYKDSQAAVVVLLLQIRNLWYKFQIERIFHLNIFFALYFSLRISKVHIKTFIGSQLTLSESNSLTPDID